MIRPIAMMAATAALASLPFFAIACSSSSSNTKPPADGGGGGPGDSATTDSPVHPEGSTNNDGGTGDSGGTLTLPEGSVGPSGTQLVTSTSVVLNGVTTDGYAVYSDTNANTFNAVPLDGGASQAAGVIDVNDLSFAAATVGISFTGVSGDNGAGTLTAWTAANGVKPIGTTVLASQFAGPGQFIDVSTDGSHIVYFDNVDATGTTADITVIGSDGTGKTVLVPGANIANQTCVPSALFAGAYVVVAACSNADGGADSSLESFTGATWTTTAMLSTTLDGAGGFSVDPTGATVQYWSTAGLETATLATGHSVVIDAASVVGPGTASYTSDGTHLVYITSAGGISLGSTSGTPAPTPLVTTGTYEGIWGLSPNNQWALAFQNATEDSANDFLTDLYLVPATSAGTATTLVNAPTATIFGDLFTADSSHALYSAAVTNENGTFTSQAVTGGMPVSLGQVDWIDTSTTTSKVVFNVNFTMGGGGNLGAADLMSADTSTTAAPKLLVTQADANYSLDAAKDKVVYSWNALSNAQAGIWVTPLP